MLSNIILPTTREDVYGFISKVITTKCILVQTGYSDHRLFFVVENMFSCDSRVFKVCMYC